MQAEHKNGINSLHCDYQIGLQLGTLLSNCELVPVKEGNSEYNIQIKIKALKKISTLLNFFQLPLNLQMCSILCVAHPAYWLVALYC